MDRTLTVTIASFTALFVLSATCRIPELLSALLPRWLWMLPVTAFLTFLTTKLVLKILGEPMMRFPKQRAVLITGCDSGFGHALAKRLDSLGYWVYACCQFLDGPGATVLKGTSSSRLRVIGLDVTNDEQIKQAEEIVKSTLGEQKLWAVVANAGVAIHGYVEWNRMEDIKKMFDVNVFGVIRTVQAFTPFVRESKGRIIITASFAGRHVIPFLVPYSMTKAAAIALADGLRAELNRFGVHVASIEPNLYRTNITPTSTAVLEATWDRLPEDIKQAYGQDTFIEASNALHDFRHMSIDDLGSAIECFEHAIRAVYPRNSYSCDRTRNLVIAKVFSWLPDEFTVFAARHLMQYLSLERRVCDFFTNFSRKK